VGDNETPPVQKQAPRWRAALLFFAAWTVVALVFAAISFAASLSENRPFGFGSALRLNAVLFYSWAVFSLLIFWFCRRFPIEFRPLKTRNLLVHLPFLVVCAIVHQFVHLTTLWFVMPSFQRQFPTLAACYRAYFGFGFYIDLIIATLLIIGAHAHLYYRRFRASQIEQAALRTELAQAQLRALKMQLHPHFLFNTLHSISSLVLEDPAKANSMIARLGDFLRLTLDHSEDQFVNLQEETEFLRCYLEIEQVRFGDRLQVEYAFDPETLSAEVPHLILQPVVENAVQHGIAPRAEPGRIRITGHRVDNSLQLEVTDSGTGLSNADSNGGRGLGLSNVRARLERLYAGDCRFEIRSAPGQGLSVVMRFPFRSKSSGGARLA